MLGFTLFTLILVRHIKRNKLGLKKADREKMHDDLYQYVQYNAFISINKTPFHSNANACSCSF